MIIQGSPEILRGPRGLNGFGDFGDTFPESDFLANRITNYKTIEELYQSIIGREVNSDPNSPFYDAGVKYFKDRFGSEISFGELAVGDWTRCGGIDGTTDVMVKQPTDCSDFIGH